MMPSMTAKGSWKNREQVMAFYSEHAHESQYSHQLKNCGKYPNCVSGTDKAPKLPLEIFKNLHFLPEPAPDAQGNAIRYKTFREIYRANQPNIFELVP